MVQSMALKSRYRNKYYKPDKPLLQSEVMLRQIIQIDGTWFSVLMIGVMWLDDLRVLEPNEKRCVVAMVNPNNGELVGLNMYNVLLTTS